MKILLATDDSRFSKAAARFVQAFAPRHSQVRVLHVLEPPSPLIARGMAGDEPELRTLWQEQQKDAEALVNRVTDQLRRKGLAVRGLVTQGEPRSEIVDVAAKWKADLIILGSHGRTGLERFAMGSVSETVVHHAPCSVMVVRVGRALDSG
jgi:nucleotide-binding universal stress UspA family protein